MTTLTAEQEEILRVCLTEFNRVKKPFPFTEEETNAILAQPRTEAWLHPLAHLAHAFIMHKRITAEPPYLVGSFGRNQDGAAQHLSCHCYYGTVSFEPYGIVFFQNWGEGGMADKSFDNLDSFYAYPAHLSAKLSELLEAGIQVYSEAPSTSAVPEKPLPDDETPKTAIKRSYERGMGY
ncbi:hypothetical protein ACYPKM_04035 [Pseudomonas aeruginosa]